jgi:hypothetical protein
MCERFGVVVETYSDSGSNDGGDEFLPDFHGVPGQLAWSCHGWRWLWVCGILDGRVWMGQTTVGAAVEWSAMEGRTMQVEQEGTAGEVWCLDVGSV